MSDLHPIRIGVDLGGTKIEAGAFTTEGEPLLRRRVPTPQGDYAATLEAIADLVAAFEGELGRRGTVGVGAPGASDPGTGLHRNANATCLNGRPLKAELEARLGREIRLANDANCFALSEAWDGAAAGVNVAFGVILGTGVGGGIVVNGEVLTGLHGLAGEWGHNPLPWITPADAPAPSCYCGKHGCLETYLSGPGLAEDHWRHTADAQAASGIATRAAQGDPDAMRTMDRYTHRLARGLAQVINLLDPEVIVLGGGLSNVSGLYDAVPKHWGAFVFLDRVRTRLVPHHHGDASGVRGAAWLWGRPRGLA